MTPTHDEADMTKTLADRIEALEGPDRDVDMLIHVQTGERVKSNKEYKKHGWEWAKGKAPPYTASIDDAMTLVPDGLPFELTRTSKGYPDEAFVWNGKELGEGENGIGATPALALCAAALRAKAVQS